MDPKKQLAKPLDLNSLPAWRQRVEIAKDVIAALKLKKLTPAHGYFSAEGLKESDMREQLDKVHCEVCAIGALFVADISRKNEFTVQDTCGYGQLHFSREELTNRLERGTR